MLVISRNLTKNIFGRKLVVRSVFTWSDPTVADTKKYLPEDVYRAGMKHHHICNMAFPIAHTETVKPYKVEGQEMIRKTIQGAYGGLKEVMVYVHVPFCSTKCQFCEFTVVNPKEGKNEEIHDKYIRALEEEFRMYDELLDTKAKKVVGFDIGGGTPSMISIENTEKIMKAVHKHFDLNLSEMEVSTETTPKIAASEFDKIKAYYDMGVRRISMGVQTTDFKHAKTIGRYDANDYLHKSVENVRKAGFKSFNMDLMYGFPLPRSGVSTFPQTVKDVIALQPEHITLYRMRYKSTDMGYLQDRVTLQQVNEEEQQAWDLLKDAGYVGMMGKNTFSKMPGSSGCSNYLDIRARKSVPYLGYGLGAQSLSHYTLQYNLGASTKDLQQYMNSIERKHLPVQDLYHLSLPAAMAKMLAVSYYYGGIDLVGFKECFNLSLHDVFSDEIIFLTEKKLMKFEGDRFQMTQLGKQHFGGVVAQFYSPSVKNHIMNRPGGEIFQEDLLDKLQRA